jgi:hypothetical protein
MSDSRAQREAPKLKGTTVVALRLDLPTAQLLQAAAAAEGFPHMATFLRQTVRTHVRQSSAIDRQLRDELVDRIAGRGLLCAR